MTRADANPGTSCSALRRAATTLALACLALPAAAQTQTATGVPTRGSGTVGVSFQFATINERTVPELFDNLFAYGPVTFPMPWTLVMSAGTAATTR